MSVELPDYPHLKFHKCWSLNRTTLLNLGECRAIISALGGLPVPPEVQAHLRQVSFERGAQATTAIEGNTLSDQELQQLVEGGELPKSRQYQGKEVTNALEAMNAISREVIDDGSRGFINSHLLKKWNKLIGQDLGELYDGIPGRFRQDRRHVGTYLAPNPEYVEPLIDDYCQWLRDEFAFGKKPQRIEEAIEQAVAAHVFFEWIHPFADGNGRTGRLLEFYILLRAGFPNLTVHVLANHYNTNRTEYAANFEIARKKRSLTQFMGFAIQGLTDGLRETLQTVQKETCKVAWESHVYRAFGGYTDYSKKTIFCRRRSLALAMPVDRPFTLIELVRSNDGLMKEYMGKGERSLKDDSKVLLGLELMIVQEKNDEGEILYQANVGMMLASHLPSRANANLC